MSSILYLFYFCEINHENYQKQFLFVLFDKMLSYLTIHMQKDTHTCRNLMICDLHCVVFAYIVQAIHFFVSAFAFFLAFSCIFLETEKNTVKIQYFNILYFILQTCFTSSVSSDWNIPMFETWKKEV